MGRDFVFSRKFQRKLVRVLFQFPGEARDILSYVEPRHFESAPMRWTVEKLKVVLKRTGVAATDTILEHEAIKDASRGLIPEPHIGAYARFIARLPDPVPDKTYLLSEAHDYIRHQSLTAFVIRTGEALTNGRVNWEQVESDMSAYRQLGASVDGGMGHDFFADIDARIKERESVESVGVPTQLPIDQSFRHGGLPPKQLGIFMAPPGRGKTALLVYTSGSAALASKDVLFISTELDESMIAERCDARMTGISISNLVRKASSVAKKIKQLRKKGCGRLRIKYFPPGGLTLAGLRLYLSRLETVGFYPGLLAIDYADNMNLSEFRQHAGDQDYGPLGRLYVGLRGLAGELNIPVWTASQTNRLAVSKKDLGMEDLADSFRKAAVADVIVGVGQSKREARNQAARLVVLKNRNGETETDGYSVRFDPGRVQFTSPGGGGAC